MRGLLSSIVERGPRVTVAESVRQRKLEPLRLSRCEQRSVISLHRLKPLEEPFGLSRLLPPLIGKVLSRINWIGHPPSVLTLLNELSHLCQDVWD